MGIGREVVSLEAELVGLMRHVQRDSRVCAQIQFILNDGYRNVGLYRNAMSYARSLSGRTPESRVVSMHRLAGDLWLSGDYPGAALRFESALRTAVKERRRYAPQTLEYKRWSRELAEIGITYLHCLRDSRRRGVIWRVLVSPHAVRIYRRVLECRDAMSDSPHSLAKLVRLHQEMQMSAYGIPFPSDIEERYPQLRDVFHETDSFTGAVNYLRRELTNLFHQSLPVDAPALDHLYALSELIDDRPGMLKAALLRRAAVGGDTPGIDRVLREIQWTRWNKRRWKHCWKHRRPWALN
jgi:hypothetical protein